MNNQSKAQQYTIEDLRTEQNLGQLGKPRFKKIRLLAHTISPFPSGKAKLSVKTGTFLKDE